MSRKLYTTPHSDSVRLELQFLLADSKLPAAHNVYSSRGQMSEQKEPLTSDSSIWSSME